MSKKHGKHKGGQPDAAEPAAEPGAPIAAAVSDGAPAGGEPSAVRAAPGIAVVAPGDRFDLAAVDPDADGGLDKAWAKAALRRERGRIDALQARLYAERRRSLLLVFQAIDTGGKDGTIRAVLRGVNPQGCAVASFKVPSVEERDHDFLWRYHARTPGRGMIGVFNRSHYEDVLVARVKGLAPEAVWRGRYGLINEFERLLAASGTTICKFLLHISKDEQRERLEARLADPEKHWKFDPADLVERESWDAYQAAFAEALARCSTPRAPWLVVPGNRKWFRNYAVAKTVADTLAAMDPRFPDGPEGLSEVTVPR